ncbi:response regulator [Pseudomonas sp. NPDC088368]|jgi:DNA-binding NtrC family response regulator|uniref:response regulator n=1 Tax=Pseudomonas sp. NPDC088368 TaxID=3364453 RepID=UPI00381C0DA6
MISDSHGYSPITGKVVIVEDDSLMQSILVDMFTDVGAECAAFVTADDALIHLMQSKIECVLLVTDFTLPGQLDGRELAFMVSERWPDMPVIVTTGYGSEVGDDLPPFVAFLQKPWSIDLMMQTASMILSTATSSRRGLYDISS